MRLPIAILGLFLAAAPAFADTRVALVVGEGAYRHAPILPNPAADAAAMAKLLGDAGFATVRLVTDGSRSDLQKALRDFANLSETADIAVFYYAGHGVEIAGRNYVVPVDADLRSDLDADDQAIDLDYVLKRMEGARKLKLVILDACRENPFKLLGKSRKIGRGLAPPSAMEAGTLIAFAAQPGALAEDGDGGHSPYTAALLTHLAAPGVEIGMALRRVHDAVLRGSGRNRQEPWTNGAIGAEEIYFGAPPGQAGPAAAAPAAPAPDVSRRDSEARQTAFEAAMAAGTVAALDDFLAQDQSGPLGNIARRERDRLIADAARARREKAGAEASRAPDPPPRVPPPAAAQQYHFVSGVRPPDDWLALRTEPATERGRRLKKLPNGTLLEVLSKRADGWWRIRIVDSGEVGWALSGESGKLWIRCCAGR